MQSSKNQIETKVLKSSRGEIFFAEDFMKYGSPENIRLTLFRMEKEGLLTRLSHGIYLKPKQDPIFGNSYPSTQEIVKEIAKRDKARIAPTGILALYLLGLTTQIPLKSVYLTDGSQREIKIGNRTIKFKRTAPRSFAVKHELLHLVVQAFKATGQKEMTDSFLQSIKPSVQKVDKQIIKTQLKYVPVWIQKEVNRLYQLN